MTGIVAWFLGTKIGRWVGAAIGVVALILGILLWLTLRDKRMMAKGADLLKGKQAKKLAEERKKRDDNEDDLRTMPDRDLDDELRQRPRDS